MPATPQWKVAYHDWAINLLRRMKRWKGIGEAVVPPRWYIVLRCVLLPSTIPLILGAHFYDPIRDIYTIHGYKFTGAVFDALIFDKTPGPWVRVVKRDNKVITIEQLPKQEELK